MTTFAPPAADLPLVTDRVATTPLTAQITTQLRAALSGGHLVAGERLPSTRSLAATLGVSRTVVTTAYAQLFAEGWLDGRHGSGTYVADGAPGVPAGLPAMAGSAVPVAEKGLAPAGAWQQSADDAEPPLNLRPGIPWTAGIDQAAWRRAWRLAGSEPPSSWLDTAGNPALRTALSGYLRRSRGVRCTPDQILVTRGVSASLRLLAAALLRPGDRVGVEEPGYPAARAVFEAHGARLVPCPVDSAGLVVDELPGNLRLVYSTPAHQYPLGGRLPVPRRQALVAWARSAGALIIEDDYDGEFRYDVGPLPALFGLDPEVVVYLGTTTKTLTPALGGGWLVARPDLVSRIADTAARLGERVPEPVQHAVRVLLEHGDLERHIRRMRHEYARRRAAMAAVLGGAAGGWPAGLARLAGDTAGMHMILELPADVAGRVAEAAWQRGVAVQTLERYFAGPATTHGLVLGYGAARLGEVTRACQVLAEMLCVL